MIVKIFELEKNLLKSRFFLFYGENQGHKNQIIEEKFKKEYQGSIYT